MHFPFTFKNVIGLHYTFHLALLTLQIFIRVCYWCHMISGVNGLFLFNYEFRSENSWFAFEFKHTDPEYHAQPRTWRVVLEPPSSVGGKQALTQLPKGQQFNFPEINERSLV